MSSAWPTRFAEWLQGCVPRPRRAYYRYIIDAGDLLPVSEEVRRLGVSMLC